MKTGAELILDERQRQITDKGYSLKQDDTYKKGALTMAGITYATVATSSPSLREAFRERAIQNESINHWPWEPQFLKVGIDDCHSSRIRELTKAGALIAAEIDKLQREAN
jgi:hypothetical protein